VTWWRRSAQNRRVDLDALLYTADAAAVAGVQPHDVRRWALRYPLVMPVRLRDRRGRPKYRLRDVLAVEKATRTGARLTA
jgi:hypothetical protein